MVSDNIQQTANMGITSKSLSSRDPKQKKKRKEKTFSMGANQNKVRSASKNYVKVLQYPRLLIYYCDSYCSPLDTGQILELKMLDG